MFHASTSYNIHIFSEKNTYRQSSHTTDIKKQKYYRKPIQSRYLLFAETHFRLL